MKRSSLTLLLSIAGFVFILATSPPIIAEQPTEEILRAKKNPPPPPPFSKEGGLIVKTQDFADNASPFEKGGTRGISLLQNPQIKILERSPRDFGFVLGDIIRQRFSLTLPAGQQLNANTLPSPGRLNDWLDLREFHFTPKQESSSTNGTQPQIYELDFTYQLFKQLDAPGNIIIPSTTLLITGHDPLALPKWTISYGTLLPVGAQQTIPLRPATKPKTIATDHWLTLLYAALAGLLLCLFSGLCWYYLPFFQRWQQPFTRASRQLKTLHNKQGNHPQQALNIFQQALTQNAGKTVFPDRLNAFFAEHPHYQPLADRTYDLLQQAHRARFAPNDTQSALPDTADILKLCQAYSRKEQAAWER